jgi:hypothetical protein
MAGTRICAAHVPSNCRHVRICPRVVSVIPSRSDARIDDELRCGFERVVTRSLPGACRIECGVHAWIIADHTALKSSARLADTNGMCGNGCRCAKADLAVEQPIEPGTPVKIECSMCKGSGEDRFYDPERPISRFNDPHCWRCEGAGTRTLVTEPEHCPSCAALLTSDQIAKESMCSYGATHFSRAIGISRMDLDCTVAYSCPDCKAVWERGSDNIITMEAAMSAPAEAWPHAPVDHTWGHRVADDPRGPGVDRLDLVEIDEATEL